MSPVMIEAIVVLAAKYGPQLIIDLEQLFAKPDVTLADVATLFAKVKTYDSYGIPTAPVVKP